MVGVDRILQHGWKWSGKKVRHCHLISTPKAEIRMHWIAEQIGLKRSHCHEGAVPHYDLVASKRKQAIDFGAIELTNRQFHDVMKAWRK